MLVLNPGRVELLGGVLEGVVSVAVHRRPERLLIEWGNGGPYPVFADVPDVRVEVELVASVSGSLDGAVGGLSPGASGELVFWASPTAGSGRRRRVRAEVVVVEVRYEVGSSGSGGRVRVRLAAVSVDGASDPVSIADASDGSL